MLHQRMTSHIYIGSAIVRPAPDGQDKGQAPRRRRAGIAEAPARQRAGVFLQKKATAAGALSVGRSNVGLSRLVSAVAAASCYA